MQASRRGILLLKLDGWDLNDKDCPAIESSKLSSMLKDALKRTSDLGVKHHDLKLPNVYFVPNHERIMLIDWELFSKTKSDTNEKYVECESNGLLGFYNRHRAQLRTTFNVPACKTHL